MEKKVWEKSLKALQISRKAAAASLKASQKVHLDHLHTQIEDEFEISDLPYFPSSV